MNTFLTVVFGLVFFTLLMASVALHEVGHMLPAKLFGVKVPKYFVGFGKTLWSTRRGDTEYGVKVFPLGGFVQLLGIYPPANPEARQTWLTRFADDARAVEWDEITPADTGRLLYAKPTWQKIIVMAGGITMNLVLCFALLWGVFAFHGVVRQQTTLASVHACAISEARACTASDPASPAAQAGLQPGDRIVDFNGTQVASYRELTDLIRANLDREATIVVERAGTRVTLPTVHTIITGVPDRLDPSTRVAAGWLGVTPTATLETGGPGDALTYMGELAQSSVVALVQFPIKVWNVAVDMVTGKPRDLNGPLSILGASAIAGGVATSNADIGDRVAAFATLLASVNLFLALFNLIPLPPLDGGHIAGSLYEALKRGLYRVLGRPDPGPADTARMLPVAYAVGAFLLLCGVVLIIADIVSPMRIF